MIDPPPPDDLLATTLALVEIPSPSGREAALATHLRERLVPVLGVPRWEEGNAMVLGGPTAPGRPVLALAGHLDTVPPVPGLEPRLEGEVLHGRGAVDMKGGLAVLLALVAGHRRGASALDLLVILYDQEEGPLEDSGLRRLLPACPWLREEIALAVCLEPTESHVEAGCLGSLHARVTIPGRRGHSARPWTGDNAIHRAAPIIDRFARYPERQAEVNGVRFRENFSVTMVQGGTRPNVIPGVCELNVNVRFAPDHDLAWAEAEVRRLCAGEATVEVVDRSPAAPPVHDHPFVASLVASAGTSVRGKLGWTDVAQLTAAGIPAINFGPGAPELSHHDEEHISRAELELCHRALRELIG